MSFKIKLLSKLPMNMQSYKFLEKLKGIQTLKKFGGRALKSLNGSAVFFEANSSSFQMTLKYLVILNKFTDLGSVKYVMQKLSFVLLPVIKSSNTLFMHF